MPSQSYILDLMQFSFFLGRDSINETGAPAASITYQYAGTSEPVDLPQSGAGATGYTAFTRAEKTAFELALEHIETFLNVDFEEVTGSADPDLNVAKVYLPGTQTGSGGPQIAATNATNITDWDGFVQFDNELDLSQASQMNLLLHELGHALGLDHPGGDSYGESNKKTLMSLTENPDNGLRSDGMQIYDMLALQDIWGAANYNEGATTYTGSRNNTVDTIWDTSGKDTLDASHKSRDVVLNLKEGAFSTFDSKNDVAIAYGTRIEKAKGGSGDDKLIGTKYKNVLTGNDGNDNLNGGGGNDTLKGGGQKDTLKGGGGNDILKGGGGADTFVFRKGDDQDSIKDFKDDVDMLKITGYGSVTNLLSYASDDLDNVVFDFGNGDMITVFGISKSEISDDILV